MRIDNATETRESWAPLEQALGHALCIDFMWMGSAGTVQVYKHMDTRRHLMIDAVTATFYDEDHRSLSREAAVSYVLSS